MLSEQFIRFGEMPTGEFPYRVSDYYFDGAPLLDLAKSLHYII